MIYRPLSIMRLGFVGVEKASSSRAYKGSVAVQGFRVEGLRVLGV